MTIDPATLLLSQLRGKQIIVPPMRPHFQHWHRGVSPFNDELHPEVDRLLLKYVPEKAHLKKARGANFPLFASAWFPDSKVDELQFQAIYAMFLFVWDDDVDCKDTSRDPELANNIDIGTRYRQQTLKYLEYHLGLMPEGADEPHCDHAQVEIFAAAAKFFRKTADADTTARFMSTLTDFINACQDEQVGRLAGHIPSVADYWQMRLNTSAVYTICATVPYMTGVSLPPALMDSAEMAALWLETNRNVTIGNDILSMQKEILDGVVVHLIPVTMAETGASLTQATEMVINEFIDCCRRFEDAARRLRFKAAEYGVAAADIDAYIKCFEAMQTGCDHWSMLTDRYGVKKMEQLADGSLVIKI